MDFWCKWFMKITRKKHSFHNKQIYIYRSQTFLCFMKHNHYGYTPPYMHKPLPTLGKEKEQKQIEFFEKLSGELIFWRVTKNVKIIYITHPTGQVLKKQVYTTAIIQTQNIYFQCPVFTGTIKKDISQAILPCPNSVL